MATRTLSRALRSPLAKQLSAPARRTFVSAINASARPTARIVVASAQQVRGVKTIDFAGTKEDVYGMLYSLQAVDWELTGFQRELTGLLQSSRYTLISPNFEVRLTLHRNTSKMTQWPSSDTDRKVTPNL
jgi:hypothetical protein